jgi:hypothetical protein
VRSIHLIKRPQEGKGEDEVEFERPEDLVDFVEREDGTRVEVKRRKFELGDEVTNEEGGRMYRVASPGVELSADGRSRENT